MGYDSNIKSQKSEQRQRIVIVVSLVALSAAFLLVVSLLSPPGIVRRNGSIGGGVADRHVDAVASSLGKMAASIIVAKNEKNKLLRGDEGERKNSPDAAKSDQAAAASSETNNNKLDEIATLRSNLEAQVRSIKATGIIMETDKTARGYTQKLQDVTRQLISLQYGQIPSTQNYRVEMELEFQKTIPDYTESTKYATLLVELAPISILPCSVYNFLEIARTWKHGAFHRNAGHVLQAISRSNITQSMPFQEYDELYPHKKGTMGYAGRPSGPEFYISIQDNTEAHGPGSQQKHNPYEADSLFGTVIQGMDDGTVDRIHTMPGREFINEKEKWVLIRRMRILVPKTTTTSGEDGGTEEEDDGYVEFSKSPLVIPKD